MPRPSPACGLFLVLSLWTTLGAFAGSETGRVTLPPDVPRSPETELHLFQAGTPTAPRKPTDQIGTGVPLPAGRAMAALWDRQAKRYVALSRLFEVRPDEAVEIPFQLPRDAAHLIVEVRRHATVAATRDLGIDLVLKLGRDERRPDLVVLTSEGAQAVWAGLPPGAAELRARSGQTFFGPQPLDLLIGKIEHVSGELKPLPALGVEVDLPESLRREELTLVVRRLPAGEIVAEHTLAPDLLAHRFEGLPQSRLAIDLLTSLGSFTREVDLGSGTDAFLLLDPELITLHGTVSRGDRPLSARLRLTTVERTRLETRTDDEGAYEMTFLEPLALLVIEGAGGEFDVRRFSPALADSRELDIHLPDNDLRVKVVDAATGEGVAGASVSLFHQETEATHLEVTDDAGVARLSSLGSGALEIQALAKGYLPPREPVWVEVDGKKDQDFEVRLDPLGETVALHLTLPNGAPAAGAEVWLAMTLEGPPLATASANGEGVVELPRQAGVLLAKHRAAAFLVRPWRPHEGEQEVEWAFPDASGRPLTVQVRDSAGKGLRSELALWIGGNRLAGSMLAWLTDTDSRTDSNGVWSGRNLPQAPVGILAWEPASTDRSEDLSGEATGVPFPWPEPVEVRAVE